MRDRKKFENRFLNQQSKRDYLEQKRREEQATKQFFPRKKVVADEDRNQKALEFERRWNPR